MDSNPQALLFERPAEKSVERLRPAGEAFGVPAWLLDVPETIPQLGYGSHQFFRYYGKFPSVVGGEIVRKHAREGAPVLDCYAGSGTTLVEAQNLGYQSFGVDLNPLAVLASNVKTAYPLASDLRAQLRDVLKSASDGARLDELFIPSTLGPKRLSKWFSTAALVELSALRRALLREPDSPTLDFLLTAFLGIVRRVSTAYDGEVRPHVNPTKRARSPLQAFELKASKMIDALDAINASRPAAVPSFSWIADSRTHDAYARIPTDCRPGLVVAHPPYLNSFNYLQVFSLEFAWAEGFDSVWGGWEPKALRGAEHRAWPATDAGFVVNYYDGIRSALSAAATIAAPQARVAVVIGDATIRGTLEPVHERVWDILVALGLRPVEVWFRTTHYGIGKYAYRHRADYHGEAEKKDAVLIVEKP